MLSSCTRDFPVGNPLKLRTVSRDHAAWVCVDHCLNAGLSRSIGCYKKRVSVMHISFFTTVNRKNEDWAPCLVFLHSSIDVRDQFHLGGLRSAAARIFYPLLARKSLWFCLNITWFLPGKNGYLNNYRGLQPPPLTIPPPPRTPMSSSIIITP